MVGSLGRGIGSLVGSADGSGTRSPPSSAPAAMEIGTVVTFRGRSWYVRGLDPHGVTPRSVYLEDVDSGRRLTIDFRRLATRRHLWAVDSELDGPDPD